AAATMVTSYIEVPVRSVRFSVGYGLLSAIWFPRFLGGCGWPGRGSHRRFSPVCGLVGVGGHAWCTRCFPRVCVAGFGPRSIILRHDRGLAAGPGVGYKLKVAGS